MVPRDLLIPALGADQGPVAPQGARVPVEKAVSVARDVEATAPGEGVILDPLDVFGVALDLGQVRMRVVDVVGQAFRVIEAAPGVGDGDLSLPDYRAAFMRLIPQYRPLTRPRA